MKLLATGSLKFAKLKRRLSFPHWQVVGVLESLWLFTQHNCPEGDIGRFSNEDIAAGIEWAGDADQLIQALAECGWLDACEVNRLLVHDWEDHAPNFLKGNMKRYGKEFAKHAAKEATNHAARDARMQPSDPHVRATTLCNVKETNVEKANKGAADAAVVLPPALWDGAFKTAWESWLDYRKQSRKPLKAMSQVRLLRKLEAWGPARAAAAIDHSIASGYQGIFEPPAAKNGKAPPQAESVRDELQRILDEEAAGLREPPALARKP